MNSNVKEVISFYENKYSDFDSANAYTTIAAEIVSGHKNFMNAYVNNGDAGIVTLKKRLQNRFHP